MTDSSPDTDSEPDASTDVEADATVDANANADGDTNTNADANADGDTNVNAGANGDTDANANADDEDDEIDRRRLIRWIAVLAFSVPVVVELLTFGNLLEHELFPGGDDAATATDTPTDADDAVGVGDELLPETAASETVTTSEVRQDDAGDRTYVLRVDVENGTEAAVELRTRALRLRDGSTVDGLSSTGEVPPGESREVTAAWSIPSDAMPAAVECVAVQGGQTAFEGFVDVERPPIVG